MTFSRCKLMMSQPSLRRLQNNGKEKVYNRSLCRRDVDGKNRAVTSI